MSVDRARILIIEDDPMFRSLLASLLREECIISVAAEGADGYSKATHHPPDVAIIDVNMPGWDGLKTLEAFQDHPVLSRVKTLVLTADAGKETVLAAIRAGANDYLIKSSFSKSELCRKLNKLIPAERTPFSAGCVPEGASVNHAPPTNQISSNFEESTTPGSPGETIELAATTAAATPDESDTATEEEAIQHLINGWN